MSINICGVDIGLTDTKYAYRKDGKIVCSYEKPDGDFEFGYTGVKATVNAYPEFECVVAGARELTGLNDFLLLSMGTGTAFLRVRSSCEGASDGNPKSDILAGGTIHLGGTGVGGGTIKGLFSLYDENTNIKEIAKIAKSGNAYNTDLKIGDISEDLGSLLSKDITVSNLSKLTKDTSSEDYAAGIINLTAEVLMMMAVFARRDDEKIVCIGGLSQLDKIRETARVLGAMHKISFIFPENASYAGAIGCLKIFEQKRRNDHDLS
jgi:type II pantothenate kinase